MGTLLWSGQNPGVSSCGLWADGLYMVIDGVNSIEYTGICLADILFHTTNRTIIVTFFPFSRR